MQITSNLSVVMITTQSFEMEFVPYYRAEKQIVPAAEWVFNTPRRRSPYQTPDIIRRSAPIIFEAIDEIEARMYMLHYGDGSQKLLGGRGPKTPPGSPPGSPPDSPTPNTQERLQRRFILREKYRAREEEEVAEALMQLNNQSCEAHFQDGSSTPRLRGFISRAVRTLVDRFDEDPDHELARKLNFDQENDQEILLDARYDDITDSEASEWDTEESDSEEATESGVEEYDSVEIMDSYDQESFLNDQHAPFEKFDYEDEDTSMEEDSFPVQPMFVDDPHVKVITENIKQVEDEYFTKQLIEMMSKM